MARQGMEKAVVEVSVHDLAQAVRTNNISAVQHYLDSISDNSKVGQVMVGDAINLAAQLGHVEIVGLFLSAGVDIASTNSAGESLLSQVAKIPDADLLQRLLSLGADSSFQDHLGLTPLHHAVSSGCLDCVKAIVSADGRAAPSDAKIEPIVVQASRLRHLEIVTVLLTQGYSPDQLDDSGRTALWWACQVDDQKLVKLLLLADANILRDASGRSPLHVVAKTGSQPVMQQLLSFSSVRLVRQPSHDGKTPLMIAAFYDQPEMIAQLVAQGANVDTTDARGDSAMIIAVKTNALSAATELVKAGASLQQRNLADQNAYGLIELRDDESWRSLRDSAPSEFVSILQKWANH